MKKKFTLAILLLLILISQAGFGRTFYVSNSGNDNNSGTSTGSAWLTINKVNGFSFASGDIILFNRGNIFYGGIVLKRSNLSFGAYGSGADPIITGLSTVSGWVNLGGNIWEAPVSKVKSGVNLVLRNDIVQQVGRYPNVDASDGGYLTYTAATNSSITGPAQSSTTNWTGAEIAIKENRWSISRQKVTSHSGGVVHFTNNPTLPRLNYGYFFQRDSRTLDDDGEWWHNVSGSKLRMYFSSNNPNSYTIQVATVDTLFKSSSYNNITISDLSFDGSGRRTIWISGGSNIAIKNCDINNSGAEAITIKSASGITIDNCTISNSLGSGINFYNTGGGTVNILIQNCTILNTAFIPGMETSNEGNGGEGIKCMGGNGVNILHNSVTNSGYNGIKWQGNDVNIKYNYVNKFNYLRDDGAGIYSWEESSTPPTRTNRKIIGNIVINGIGSHDGTNDETTSTQGIYLDLGTKNVIIDSNTVANVANGALHGNNCGSLTIRYNTFFGCARTASLQRFAGAPLIRNIIIKKNIMYPYRFRYRNLGINSPAITKENDIEAMGTIDSNYYALGLKTDTSLTTVTTNADGGDYQEENYAFAYITGTVGIEKNSTKFSNSTLTLEYNASNSPKIVSFAGLSKKDVLGNVFNNSVTIPAWGSKVLLPNGSATTTNKAPVAIAGNGLTITLPINTVTLNGSGTDSDGSIVKYSWAKISGPSSGTIVTPLGAITIILNLVAGTYQYELTVTDDDGATGKDTVVVNVNPLNGTTLLPAVNPSNTVNGLDYKYYEGTWSVIPTFTSLSPVKTGTVSNFDISPAESIENYGFSFTGYVSVPADGQYTFYSASDDGSKLLIDNVLVVSNDGSHATREVSGVIGLKAGKHAITCLYIQIAGGADLAVSYQSSSLSKRAVPASALYRVNSPLLPAVNPANTVNGLDYKYYEGAWLDVPAFSTLTPLETGAVANFDLSVANVAENYGFNFTGYINVPADGIYNFYTNSDDGSNLYIDNVLVVANGGLHGPNEEGGAIGLMAGKHAITVSYFNRGGGGALDVSYESEDISKRAVPASALYRVSVVTLYPAVNPANTVNGLNYKYYEGAWIELPNFDALTPVKTGTVSNFSLSPATTAENFGFSFTGYVSVPADGMYTFYTSSDDGSELWIDNVLVVTNDGLHGPNEESGVIGLKAGKHYITGLFFQRGGGSVFTVSYQSSGITKRAVPSSALYRVNAAPPPVAARNGNSVNAAPGLNVVPNKSTTLKINSYPNPSATEFTLRIEGGSDKKIEVMVIDADGRAVFSATGTSNTIYKFGYNFMPGVYFIKVVQEDKFQTFKVVKSQRPN